VSADVEPSGAAAHDAPVLRTVSPILPVADVAAATRFYCDVLGFRVGWTWGDPPTVASVCRDAVELMLERRDDAIPPGPARIYLTMSGVQALHDAAVAAGARVAVPLAARDYGMRDCRLVDPDGNELSFGEPSA
jgi:catechol 2,3-dioxygenase-like lactoylglutathione lyase family enzyme